MIPGIPVSAPAKSEALFLPRGRSRVRTSAFVGLAVWPSPVVTVAGDGPAPVGGDPETDTDTDVAGAGAPGLAPVGLGFVRGVVVWYEVGDDGAALVGD